MAQGFGSQNALSFGKSHEYFFFLINDCSTIETQDEYRTEK